MTILQASAVPFRRMQGRVQVCVITTGKSGNWGLPKGIIDPGETPEETALKESAEEAGVLGTIVGAPIGRYQYEKWETDLDVALMMMRVNAWSDDWPEAEWRERRWVSLDELPRLGMKRPPPELIQRVIDWLRQNA